MIGPHRNMFWLFACLGISGLVTGCATPDYLLPGGYSSTYHKAIQGSPGTVVVPAPGSNFSPVGTMSPAR